MTLELIMPLIIAVVTMVGSGALVKAITERQLRKAEADKTTTDGDIATSVDYRSWVQEERQNARNRIEAADKRMDAAELKADSAQKEAFILRNRVEELEDKLRDVLAQLKACPGGVGCPMYPACKG